MSTVSRELSIDYDTLRQWVKRHKSEGPEGLCTKYGNCGLAPTYDGSLLERALALKEGHRGWGAGYVRIQLARSMPGSALPSERQLQRWFAQAGLCERRTRLPSERAGWARRPFERVQADAKERLRTADGRECCYLNFTDEHSGAVLDAFVFPLRPDWPGARAPGLRCGALPDVPLGLHQLLPG